MAAPSPSPSASDPDGPVLSLLNKRLRALRKKYNRVLQMEESLAKGKTLNKEQEEVLRSKPQLSALIDEYERLRAPLSSALHEELSLPRSAAAPASSNSSSTAVEDAVDDVLRLLYFARLFDVRPQADYETTMLMRSHERGCCITYDTVTDETTSFLEYADLDLISSLGASMLARPPNSDVSHRAALADCSRHARAWLARSDDPVLPGSPFTYSGLRERLNRIWGSNYSTAMPEIKPSADLVVDVGNYGQEAADEDQLISPAEAECEPKVDGYENLETKGPASDESSEQEEPTNLNTSEVEESYTEVPPAQLDELNNLEDNEQNYREREPEQQQQQQQQYVHRRGYGNQRAPRGGGRRPFGNGRGGGRGGRGGRAYQNGRGQYYDSGYHPGNFYAPRGRNGRGGNSYNTGGTSRGGHNSGVELGAS